MKTLYLLRHAQAASAAPMESDHARPLTPDGRAQTEALKSFMAGKSIQPQIVLASDSRRTMETAQLSGLKDITALPGLYLATSDDIAGIVQTAADTANALMIVAHNPGIGDLSLSFSGDEIYSFTPGTLAVFTTTAESWLLISPENTQLREVYTP